VPATINHSLTVDWFATSVIGTLTIVQYRYPPLPAASAVGSHTQLPKLVRSRHLQPNTYKDGPGNERPSDWQLAQACIDHGGLGVRLSQMVLVLLTLSFFVGCREPSTQSAKKQPKGPELSAVKQLEIKAFQMPRNENPGYVGPQACGECHQERLEECLSTSHFKTCRVPDPQSMPKGFAEGATFELPNTNSRFEMSQSDGRYFQAAVDKSSPNASRTVSTIDLILGAGKSSDEVYLSWHVDDTLWELPVAWVYAYDCWGASGFDRNSGGDHARPLTLRCFECHNTWFEHARGSLAEYKREEILLGVTCERCHGPGKDHVAFHRSRPTETESHNILLPSTLPRERLIEVCTQCHGNAIRHRGQALSFRPGDELDKHYRTVKPAYSEDDHVANQIDGLRESQCFRQSEMTCITCHDPHLTDKPTDGSNFSASCTGCHSSAECKKQADLPIAIRNKCSECHMRKYVKINVNFDHVDDSYVPPTRRSSHRIAVDPIGTMEVLWKWLVEQAGDEYIKQRESLELELVDAWLAQAKDFGSVGRYRAAIAAVREGLLVAPNSMPLREKLAEYVALQTQLDADLSAGESASRLNQDTRAKALFEKVLQQQPDNALITGKLGTILAKQGDIEAAKKRLRSVLKLDPDEQYGLSMLAWFALREKDYATAQELYRQADSIEPFNAKILTLWGESCARAGDFPGAMDHYQMALQSNPRQLDAIRGIAIAKAAEQDFDKALEYATQAVQLTNYQNLLDLKRLVELQLELGQKELGLATVEHMLTIAKNDPKQENEIRAWAIQTGLKVDSQK